MPLGIQVLDMPTAADRPYDSSPPILSPQDAMARFAAQVPAVTPPAAPAAFVEAPEPIVGGYSSAPPLPGDMAVLRAAVQPDPIPAPITEADSDEYAAESAIEGWLMGLNGTSGYAVRMDKVRAVAINVGGTDNRSLEVCAECGIGSPIRLSAHRGASKRESAEASRDRIMQAIADFLDPSETVESHYPAEDLTQLESETAPRRGPGRPRKV